MHSMHSMHSMPGRILLVFLDGVGLGPADPDANPLAAAELPTLQALLGRAPVVGDVASTTAPDGGVLLGLDATLEMPGLPQSGTGQTALLTGENAARLFGGHRGPWVPTRLRPLLRRSSLLARAGEAGRSVAFANAYPEELFRHGAASGPALRAGPPLAALGAGVLTRHTPALRSGEAVASEIVNTGWREHLGRVNLPDPGPAEAGATLARIAGVHELTLFAHYTTDLVGHRGSFDEAVAAVQRVDAFLGGVLEGLPADALLVVTSDHGNLEDVSAEHTRNPALTILAGAGAAAAARGLVSIMDVAPRLLSLLDVAWGPASDLAEAE